VESRGLSETTSQGDSRRRLTDVASTTGLHGKNRIKVSIDTNRRKQGLMTNPVQVDVGLGGKQLAGLLVNDTEGVGTCSE
jgi:hypothetical protein